MGDDQAERIGRKLLPAATTTTEAARRNFVTAVQGLTAVGIAGKELVAALRRMPRRLFDPKILALPIPAGAAEPDGADLPRPAEGGTVEAGSLPRVEE